MSGGLARRFAAPALAAGWLAAQMGWTAAERPWAEATGWHRVPAGERPSPPPPWPAAAGEPPRLTWLGHSGFLVEWHGRRILLDPHTGPRCTLARRVLERPLGAAALGAVDAALISHAHYDHLDLPTLAAVPRLDLLVVPAGSERWAARLPERVRVIGAGAGEAVDLAPLAAVAVPAAHNGHRHHPLGGGRRAVGWVLRAPAAALYFAGDTGPGLDFAAIGRRWRPLLAILPIGAYAPRWPLARLHLTPEAAVVAGLALGVAAVVPCHFGTFRLSLDRPADALPRFARAAAAAGLAWLMPRPGMAVGPVGEPGR